MHMDLKSVKQQFNSIIAIDSTDVSIPGLPDEVVEALLGMD